LLHCDTQLQALADVGSYAGFIVLNPCQLKALQKGMSSHVVDLDLCNAF